MSVDLHYYAHDERPSAELWWRDDDNSLVDLSSGYTFSLKIGNPGSSAVLTKTTGITGAAGSGSEPDGTPNVVIAWSAGDLDLTPGIYALQLKATNSSLDRTLAGSITIHDVID